MTKKEILDYVMENPGNTNVSVLGPMVDAVAGVAPTGKITITENGSDIDVAQYAKADVAVNPNYTQTITGTAAAPFGDVDFDTLRTAIYGRNATAFIVADGSAIGATTIRQYLTASDTLVGANGAGLSESTSVAYEIGWSSSGLSAFLMENNGTVTDVSSYASAIPTTLTIYWHPLLGEGE